MHIGLPARLNLIATSFLFEPSTTEVLVPLEIIEDSLPNGLASFQLSIAKPIEIIGENVINPSTVTTALLNIFIYDNDCKCS